MEDVETTRPYEQDCEKIQFFYDLVNESREIRDQTQEKLKNYLMNGPDIDLQELLDINNYLYDAMWNADGYDIQREFANFYGKLIFIVPKSNVIMFIRSMLISTMNKWAIMDKHRINKYYSMIRQIINQIFSFLSLIDYESNLYEDILSCFKEIVFTQEPFGVAYHIFDVLLHELHLASPNITTDQYVKLLYCIFESCASQDKVYIKKCKEQIFHPLIFEYLPKSDFHKPPPLKIIKNNSKSNDGHDNDVKCDVNQNNNGGDVEVINNAENHNSTDNAPEGTNQVTTTPNQQTNSNSKNKKLRNKKNQIIKKKVEETKKIKSFPQIDIRKLLQPIFNYASRNECSASFRKMLYFLTDTYKKYCQNNFNPKDIPTISIEFSQPGEKEENQGNVARDSIEEESDEYCGKLFEDGSTSQDEDIPPPPIKQTKKIVPIGKNKIAKKSLRFDKKVTVRHIPSQKRHKRPANIPQAQRKKPKMVRE